jgi:uroporphyrin-III C-methyltransferase/precorrin-2 dehydrogenase/sirohydrochlorin ferrochelatase
MTMDLPILFKSGFSCLIIGGGQVATRKMEVLLDLPCKITLIAPHITETIDQKVRTGDIRWVGREYIPGDCKGFELVIAATPVKEVNRSVSVEARSLCIPVNVVDDPAISSVIFPALWREKSLVVAVSTEGVAPFMAAEIRDRLAQSAREMGRWVEIAGVFREIVRGEITNADERDRLYKRFLKAGQPGQSCNPPESRRLADWLSWLDGIQKEHRDRAADPSDSG